VHLGYDLAARRRGGYLPGTTSGEAAGTRIVALAADYEADHVVVAGDLRHSTRDVDDAERAEVSQFARAIERECTLTIVRGNHDAGDAIAGLGETTVRIGDVDITHVPPAALPERPVICGHLHPRITVRDETGTGVRYPCVLEGARTVVLPAFSEWAGGVEAARLVRTLPHAEWRALPVHDGLIADLGIVFLPAGA
ncbi:MAG: metallophosphoesterase, partial [Gemmatimonadaceae bacterium]